jgi:hypothetical protein
MPSPGTIPNFRAELSGAIPIFRAGLSGSLRGHSGVPGYFFSAVHCWRTAANPRKQRMRRTATWKSLKSVLRIAIPNPFVTDRLNSREMNILNIHHAMTARIGSLFIPSCFYLFWHLYQKVFFAMSAPSPDHLINIIRLRYTANRYMSVKLLVKVWVSSSWFNL